MLGATVRDPIFVCSLCAFAVNVDREQTTALKNA